MSNNYENGQAATVAFAYVNPRQIVPSSVRGLTHLIFALRQRSLLIHAHVECWGKALAPGSASHLVEVTALDRVLGLRVERIEIPLTDAQRIDVLNAMAGAPIWLRVSRWDMFLCWVTMGRMGNDCVKVVKTVLAAAGIDIPRRVRRVKELKECLTLMGLSSR